MNSYFFSLKKYLIILFLCQFFLLSKTFSAPILDQNNLKTEATQTKENEKSKLQVIEEAIQIFEEHDQDIELLIQYKEKIVSNSLSIEDENKLALNIIKKSKIANIYKPDNYTQAYNSLLKIYNDSYKILSREIPKLIHFIWLGGPMGEIQKDYIKVWNTINPDYAINIWYDPKALFNYKAKKLIDTYFKNNDPASFPDNVIKFQNEFFEHSGARVFSDNERSMQFLTANLFFDKEQLKDDLELSKREMKANIKELEAFGKGQIVFQMIQPESDNWMWQLKNEYHQEMFLRMNFAAAGDLARLEILKKHGGIYLDVDILPTILDELNFLAHGKNSELFAEFHSMIDLASYESIFNENEYMKNFMKGRAISTKYFDTLIQDVNKDHHLKNQTELLYLIKELAIKYKENDINSLFNKMKPISIKQGELFLSSTDRNNNRIICHQSIEDDDMISSLINKVKENYMLLNSLMEGTDGTWKNIDKMKIKYKGHYSKIMKKFKTPRILEKMKMYRYDGYLEKAEATVFISGPIGPYADVIHDYYENLSNFIPNDPNINHIFNANTEEDVKSSWLKPKENQITLPGSC